jgi:hypothetical protein
MITDKGHEGLGLGLVLFAFYRLYPFFNAGVGTGLWCGFHSRADGV